MTDSKGLLETDCIGLNRNMVEKYRKCWERWSKLIVEIDWII